MSANHRLEGRTALVTGAIGGIGAAICRALSDDGARIVLVDLDKAKLSAAALSGWYGPGAHALPLDIADPAAVAKGCFELQDAVGGVDILVNCAGILSNNKLAATTPEEWHRIMAVNLDGAFYLSQQLVPGMKERKWGRIINIASYAWKSGGLTAGTAYTTSKGAMVSLTFSLARELASFGITVNGVAPCYVMTRMVSEQLTEEERQRQLAGIPVGRFCEPDEIGHAVRFLASPLSGFITGEILDMNGGLQFD